MADAPLPELKETDATGRIAEIYDDIRYSLRVPMVNLIFRHMATIPGCLDWAWANVGPLYIAGRVQETARKICEAAAAPRLHLTASDSHLDETAVSGVRATCEAYTRANPANLLALQALRFILEETSNGYARRKPMRGVLARATPTDLSPLPPMGDLNNLPEATRQTLKALAIQLHGGDGPVIPSFYRHFTAWPAFLTHLHQKLEAVMPEVFERGEALERLAHIEARTLYLDCPAVRLDPPSDDAVATLLAIIERFPPNICRITMVTRALDEALRT